MITTTNEMPKDVHLKAHNSTGNNVTLASVLEELNQQITENPISVSVRIFVSKIHKFKKDGEGIRQFIRDIDEVISKFKKTDIKKPNLCDWFNLNLTKIVALIRYLDHNKDTANKLNDVKEFVSLQTPHVVNESDLLSIMNKNIDSSNPEYTDIDNNQEEEDEERS